MFGQQQISTRYFIRYRKGIQALLHVEKITDNDRAFLNCLLNNKHMNMIAQKRLIKLRDKYQLK